jgi:hypothetical protein
MNVAGEGRRCVAVLLEGGFDVQSLMLGFMSGTLD